MAITEVLGAPRTAQVPAGTIAYRERGEGPPIVFVHGVGMTGDLWRHVAPQLAAHHRCICPDLPLGAHRERIAADTDMSLPGLARIVADLLEALDLRDVTIVANDTGGAISQWLVGHHGERVSRLVLTSCDAFDKYPPDPQRILAALARPRPLFWVLAKAMRFRWAQRLSIAYGDTTKEPMDPVVMAANTEGIRTLPWVRADLRRILLAVDDDHMFRAAEGLTSFDRPALVVWGADDILFPPVYGRLLAELLPQGRYTEIPGCMTFVPEEAPGQLLEMIEEFLAASD
jgi:pimeloyl-ACP methyl ester carboxylesterase